MFYNGTDKHADKEILKLSDAFIVPSEGCEWTVTMLNINKGHNLELMNKCEALKEYADFIALIREYAKPLEISQAVEHAVITFIERDGILAEFLRAHRAEVIDVCITEYNEELHLNNVLAEGINEGIAIGRDEGIAIGETRMSTLIGILAAQNRYEDIVKISSDEAFRNECFALYNIP